MTEPSKAFELDSLAAMDVGAWRANSEEEIRDAILGVGANRARNDRHVTPGVIDGDHGKQGFKKASCSEITSNELLSTYQGIFFRDDTWMRHKVKAKFGAYDENETPGTLEA